MVPTRARGSRQTKNGIWPLARFWQWGCILTITSLVFVFAPIVVAQDGWQWRLSTIEDGRQLLSFGEFEASDDFSGLSFYCRPLSGMIDVEGAADEKQRKVLADLIRAGGYSTVQLDGETALLGLAFSEVDGWLIRFDIAADGATFDKFKNTGRFEFKIGTLVVDNGVRKAGIDKISKFQAACRKPAAAPKLR